MSGGTQSPPVERSDPLGHAGQSKGVSDEAQRGEHFGKEAEGHKASGDTSKTEGVSDAAAAAASSVAAAYDKKDNENQPHR
ncbi:hypothetical protein EMMF5_004905 [Cystobasidiomycetes sp. EMM_F5]